MPQSAPRAGLAATFAHPGVAAAYRHRPPYPAEVFTILEGLIGDEPRHALDLGAGEGALARPLAPLVDRVDAVDVSAAMIDVGRERPGGRHPHLRWIVGAAEDCALAGPYALVTAGASLHWMAWGPLMARLAGVMTPKAVLSIVEHGPRDLPWREELVEVIRRHSRSPGFDPRYPLVDALVEAGHLDLRGRAETAAVTFRQPVDSYVEHFFSTASLAREHMTAAEAQSFARAIEDAVVPYAVGGALEMTVVATLTWGRPRAA